MTTSEAKPRATRRKTAGSPPIPPAALFTNEQIQTLLEEHQTLITTLDRATAAIDRQNKQITMLNRVAIEQNVLIGSFARHLLGLGTGASRAELRAAYRVKAKQHHPDAGGDGVAFALLQLALQLLEQPQA